MCTPIILDNPPSVDLSGDDPTKKPSTPDPAGTADPTPAATTPATNPAPVAKVKVLNVPGDPSSAQDGTNGTTAPGTLAGGGDVGMGPGTETGKPNGVTPAKATDPLVDQNTLLINSLTAMAHKVQDSTAGILQAQTDAATALKGGFLDLTSSQQQALDAADQLRKNTGQAARKPSYSLSLAKNRNANANGLSSTMLTGSGGVPTNTLALGRAQLLGGAAA